MWPRRPGSRIEECLSRQRRVVCCGQEEQGAIADVVSDRQHRAPVEIDSDRHVPASDGVGRNPTGNTLRGGRAQVCDDGARLTITSMVQHLRQRGRRGNVLFVTWRQALDGDDLSGGQIARLVGVEDEIPIEKHRRHARRYAMRWTSENMPENRSITPGTRSFCAYNRGLDAEISHRRRVARPGARRHGRRHAGGAAARHRRAQCAAAAAPGRLRPRPPHADRKRHAPRSSPASAAAHHRRANRAAHPQSRLGELAADDARRAGDAGGATGRAARRRDASAARPRRSRRRHQVRARRHPRRARARQRARDGGPRRRRQPRAAAAGAFRRPDRQPRHRDRRRRAARRPHRHLRRGARHRRRRAAPLRRRRRCSSR